MRTLTFSDSSFVDFNNIFTQSLAERCLNSGMDNNISKPFNIGNLLKVLAKIINS